MTSNEAVILHLLRLAYIILAMLTMLTVHPFTKMSKEKSTTPNEQSGLTVGTECSIVLFISPKDARTGPTTDYARYLQYLYVQYCTVK